MIECKSVGTIATCEGRCFLLHSKSESIIKKKKKRKKKKKKKQKLKLGMFVGNEGFLSINKRRRSWKGKREEEKR